jgi:hypothetical protein
VQEGLLELSENRTHNYFMNIQEPTIIQYRTEVYPRLVEKGVEPPAENSLNEQKMFERWLRGWKRLHHAE